MMLLNAQGRVFVAKRIDMTSEAWQMPQGGIDPGEDPQSAALRELREEIGTDRVEILARSRQAYRYDLPAHLVPVIWDGRFRGQHQHWFLMRLLGQDSEINIAGEHPEFSEWKWVPMAQLPELIVPFKRALYAALVEEFAPLAAAAR